MSVRSMIVRKRPISMCVRGAIALVCAVLGLASVRAGHEINYYPSFYPQEIRIEPLDPERAATEFVSKTDPLHVYIGAAPRFAGEPPKHVRSVESLRSFVTVSVNAQRLSREQRCGAIANAAHTFVPRPDVVPHRYPVTPYHADYLAHVDRATGSVRTEPAVGQTDALDTRFEEVPVADVLRRAGIGFDMWPAPPFAKEGWFQAYHLLRGAMTDEGGRKRADDLYQRLTHDEFTDKADQLRLERDLIDALTANCEMAVIGYRLRRRVLQRRLFQRHREHPDRLAVGIELAGVRAHREAEGLSLERLVAPRHRRQAGSGMESGCGIHRCGRPPRLVDGRRQRVPAHPLQQPLGANRVEIRRRRGTEGQAIVPRSAPMPSCPNAQTGRLVPVGANAAATGKVTYKVLASAFHDGTEMEPADFLLPLCAGVPLGRGPRRQEVRSGYRGGDGADARTVQGRARRQGGRKQDRTCRSHLHLSFADRRGVSRQPVIRPAGERAAGAAMELGAVACACPDGSGGRARHRGILAVRGGAARRAVARSGARSGAACEAACPHQGIRASRRTGRRRSKGWSHRKPPGRAGRRSTRSPPRRATSSSPTARTGCAPRRRRRPCSTWCASSPIRSGSARSTPTPIRRARSSRP